MFDPFFTTKRVGKGTGLGLSVSYSIIKKHQGEIQLTSQLGQGTTFRIILPIVGAVIDNRQDGSHAN
ncbi:sensor histidine kinase [Candidatus Methylobacter favarea]|uniref:sensor histidine kinase n=1 Tax=Candidatus Methylobacter favarea TaxID=2707345 RepID=UPI001FE83062|nr:ATP-binding protein [Candidatus Methylobacter favarea]